MPVEEPRTPQPPKFVSPKKVHGRAAGRVREFLPPLHLGGLLSPKNARSPRSNVVPVAARVRDAASVVSVVHPGTTVEQPSSPFPPQAPAAPHHLKLDSPNQGTPRHNHHHHQGNVGFEALQAAIHRVLENLNENGTKLSLDDKWLRVSHHLDTYAVDIKKRKDIDEFLSKLPDPTPITFDDESDNHKLCYTPEVCVATIDQLLKYVSSIHPRVSPIVKNLLRSFSSLIFAEYPDTPRSPKEDRIFQRYEGVITYREQAEEAIAESEGMKHQLIVSSSTTRGIGPAIDYINNLITRFRKNLAAKILRMWRAGMRSRRYTGSLERRLVAREKRIVDLEAKIESANETIKLLQKQVKDLKSEASEAENCSRKHSVEAEVLRQSAKEQSNTHKKLNNELETVQMELRAVKENSMSEVTLKNKEILKLQEVINQCCKRLRGSTEEGVTKQKKVVDFLSRINEPSDTESVLSDKVDVESSGDELETLSSIMLRWLGESTRESKLSEQTSFYLPEREVNAIFESLSWAFPGSTPPELTTRFENEIDLATKVELLQQACRASNVSCTIDAAQLQFDGNSRMLLTCNILTTLLQCAPPPESNVHLLTNLDERKTRKALSAIAKTPEEWYRHLLSIDQTNQIRKSCLDDLNLKIQTALIASNFKVGESYLTNHEVKDRRKFSIVDTGRITDQLRNSGEEVASGVDSVNLVLENHFRCLRNVYRYYSSCESTSIDNTLTRQELTQFLRDCRIFSEKNRSGSSTRRLHRSSSSTEAAGGATAEIIKELSAIGIKEKSELSQEDYTTALVTVAGNRCRGKTLAEKLNSLITNHVIPFANYVAVDEFKEELKSSQCQLVLSEVKPYLMRSYAYYSNLDTGEGSRKELSWKEFKRMVDDIRAVDEVCTHYAIMQMFLKLLSDTSSTDEQLTMNYQDFVVAICAVAAFKNPAPYLPLHQKIRRFVQVWIVQCLGKKLKWDDRLL